MEYGVGNTSNVPAMVEVEWMIPMCALHGNELDKVLGCGGQVTELA